MDGTSRLIQAMNETANVTTSQPPNPDVPLTIIVVSSVAGGIVCIAGMIILANYFLSLC